MAVLAAKPIRKAYEQDPVAVQRWLEVQYPAIAKRAKREKAVILRLDQTGRRSDASVGRSWAPIGKTPVVLKTGKRFGVNAMTPASVMRIRGRRVFHPVGVGACNRCWSRAVVVASWRR